MKKIIEKCYIFIPKVQAEGSKCVQKVYSIVHTSSFTVCNLFFDVVPPKQSVTTDAVKMNDNEGQNHNYIEGDDNQNQSNYSYDSSCILHDITFNHLHESETHNLASLRTEYFSTS